MTNVKRGRRSRPASGFSLIELVIVVVIIAIISAVAIPKMSRGAAGAGDSALISDLTTMRSALELFAQEHGGNYPNGATSTILINQLTCCTDVNGNMASTPSATRVTPFIYGPYLKSIPLVPVGANKGQTGFLIVSTTPGYTSGAAGATTGWIYDGQTIWADAATTDMDVNGVKYQTY